VEKYRNPLAAEGESVSFMTKMSKIFFKLLTSIVIDIRKEIDGSSQAEI